MWTNSPSVEVPLKFAFDFDLIFLVTRHIAPLFFAITKNALPLYYSASKIFALRNFPV